MSWRPEGWSNPYSELPKGWFGSDTEANIIHYAKQEGFEAGADAMLEAIKKMPYCTHPIMLPNGNYYLIPDKEG